jgi:hypothetical protein
MGGEERGGERDSDGGRVRGVGGALDKDWGEGADRATERNIMPRLLKIVWVSKINGPIVYSVCTVCRFVQAPV